MIKEKNIGSTLEDFLKEEKRYEEAQSQAIKRVLVWQLEEAIKNKKMTKAEMARRMHTSRSQLDRLLDPENEKIQLDTMMKAAAAVGKQVRIELEDLPLSA